MNNSEERRQLAAALRWTARLNMHEGIANHFSLSVSDDGSQFLINPYGRHWSKMKASDLLELDAHMTPEGVNDVVDPTAWAIHGALHRLVPHARCIMHVHSKYVTALACLKSPLMPPIDQNTMRFFNRVAVDTGFDGMGLGREAERLAGTLGEHRVLIMGNHGVLVVAETVAGAFDDLYYFERAAETYITALQSGLELNVVSDKVAEKTARQWENYPNAAQKHLSAICAVLEEEEPEYRE
ncbi:MAG: hypothetical protein HOC23_06185 [Halieaceae bacterium]|jgi:ribulose-5-phosphate 4-epimerase/fuculose-1-phosphate aldolase|nr:hypothetical protein [Halieaceae bacterium]